MLQIFGNRKGKWIDYLKAQNFKVKQHFKRQPSIKEEIR